VIQNIQNLDNSQVKQLAESLGLAEAHLTFFIFFMVSVGSFVEGYVEMMP